jgi:hypothetical protein
MTELTGKALLAQALYTQGEGKSISTNNENGNRFFSEEEIASQNAEKVKKLIEEGNKEGLEKFLGEKALINPHVQYRFDELIKVVRDKMGIRTEEEKYIQGEQERIEFL